MSPPNTACQTGPWPEHARAAAAATILAMVAAWPVAPAHAEETPTHTEGAARNPHEAEIARAVHDVEAAQIKGPADITLRDQAVLKLPAGYVWVPEPAAGQLMKALGNHPGERELGLVFPDGDEGGWMVVADYEPSGYIEDDDAKHWDVDKMLTQIREGTEAANADRRERGFPELEVMGWVQQPTYEANAHQLIWSMSVRHKGAPADAEASINYNTYALGREGYISFNLITGLNAIGQEKRHAQVLLDALHFDEGKRYADFDSSTDKVAEYGLAALVGGLAAKKLGLFAVAAAFLAKFAKVAILGGAGAVAGWRKYFKKKPSA